MSQTLRPIISHLREVEHNMGLIQRDHETVIQREYEAQRQVDYLQNQVFIMLGKLQVLYLRNASSAFSFIVSHVQLCVVLCVLNVCPIVLIPRSLLTCMIAQIQALRSAFTTLSEVIVTEIEDIRTEVHASKQEVDGIKTRVVHNHTYPSFV